MSLLRLALVHVVPVLFETKLRHRSPHLDHGELESVAEQEDAWNRRKAAEKSTRASCLDGIALQLPALALAEKVVERCRQVGMPVEQIPPVLRDRGSELELRAAVLQFMAAVRAAEAGSGALGPQS